MKEKLVEEWLIRAGERGGIDQAFAQWLISEGHEILWLGHSSTEFGKDIISIDPKGSFHAFQMKDEDLNLREMRKIHDQLKELLEIPPAHPRVPAGNVHLPHLITSGLLNEEAAQRIRAMNDGLRASGKPELDVVDRKSLIPRFVAMSDSFWPEKPANIRDFFSFYLAEGKGDFDPKTYSTVLLGLLDGGDESNNRKAQRIAAVGLLGNYLLNPFEREKDRWSLVQGWVMLAAHLAWAATRSHLPKSMWIQSFHLAKGRAIEQLIALSQEGLERDSLRPRDWEFDDYTRARNVIVASCVSAAFLLGKGHLIGGPVMVSLFLQRLIQNTRLLCWGESSVVHFSMIQWATEAIGGPLSALRYIRNIVLQCCRRNSIRAADEPLDPPHVSADQVLAKLFDHKPSNLNRPPSGRGAWTLEALVHFLVRRGERKFLTTHWRAISKITVTALKTDVIDDLFKWHCDSGTEAQTYLSQEQSWKLLVQEAENASHEGVPPILFEHPDFLILFLLTYPHRMNAQILRAADQLQGQNRHGEFEVR